MITAAMVKELREKTGAGMMDCKKALGETDGNMDEAVEYLRKNGQAKAEKKASRIAAEGLCTVVVKDDKTAAVVEVNSETDFVAKNETFQQFVKAVAEQAVESDAADMDAFMEEKCTFEYRRRHFALYDPCTIHFYRIIIQFYFDRVKKCANIFKCQER